jgi:hypothetical protein
MDQPVSPASGKGESDTDQDAAVATDHEWNRSAVEERAQTLGEAAGVIDDAVVIAQALCRRVGVVAVARGEDDARVDRTMLGESREESRLAERFRRLGCARDAARFGRP